MADPLTDVAAAILQVVALLRDESNPLVRTQVLSNLYESLANRLAGRGGAPLGSGGAGDSGRARLHVVR